jgi:23S rRNA (pseudouridine1915-N3)-methyltransferase
MVGRLCINRGGGGSAIKIILSSIREGRSKSSEMASLVDLYLTRAAKYTACEPHIAASEPEFWTWLDRQSGRTPAVTILLDYTGKQLTSEQLANRIAQLQRDSAQLVVFAIGPANGWSPPSRQRATQLLSLGPMTLPHELARVVLAEQLYRALTILVGHPYHSGH